MLHSLSKIDRLIPEEIYYITMLSPYGEALIAWQGQDQICHLSFYDAGELNNHLKLLQDQWPGYIIKSSQNKEWLSNLFQASPPQFKLLVQASNLQYEVWQALLQVPHGQKVSYSDIAKMIGRDQAVRAVASAIGQNNIAYLIPCHRVVRKSGDIGQYRWNSRRKESMLLNEIENLQHNN